MIIEPIKKKNGQVYTNVELVKIYYDKLKALRDGEGAKTQREREKMEDTFYQICGGSKNANDVMAFMKQIVDCPDEIEAQRIFQRGLIPVEIK
jgi:hypothetical protein